MDIDTEAHKPVKIKARPVPLEIRSKFRELLADLDSRKIIERSGSEWALPIILVEKRMVPSDCAWTTEN